MKQLFITKHKRSNFIPVQFKLLIIFLLIGNMGFAQIDPVDPPDEEPPFYVELTSDCIGHSYTIDFEDPTYADGTKILDEYSNLGCCGVQIYRLDTTGKKESMEIVEVGEPAHAFIGPNDFDCEGTDDTTSDMPDSGVRSKVGCYFLTDGPISGQIEITKILIK